MSADRDETRIVRSWLEEGVTTLPDRVLDDVLDRLPATHQRRALWKLAWLSRMSNIVRLGLAAAVVMALVLGIRVWSGSNVGNAEPRPTPTLITRPSASPISLPGATWPLTAGTYSLPAFPIGITLTVPPGWHSCSDSLIEQSVCHTPTGSALDTRVSFLIVQNVVVDPCGPGEQLRDPPVGPSVDDLVTAIMGLDGFEVSAPLDITVDGHSGQGFTLTTPQQAVCEMQTWATADRTNGVSPGEVNLLEVLDVNGTRLMIAGSFNTEEPAAADERAAVEQVMASVQFSQ